MLPSQSKIWTSRTIKHKAVQQPLQISVKNKLASKNLARIKINKKMPRLLFFSRVQ